LEFFLKSTLLCNSDILFLCSLSYGVRSSIWIKTFGFNVFGDYVLFIFIRGDISIAVFGGGKILVLIRRVGIGVVITIYFNGVVFVVLDGGLLFNLIVGGF